MRQIGRGAVDKIVRVINQVYGERIRRGGVGCHFFDDLQLAGGVCQIGRTGMACAHGVVGVVGLDADVVAICNDIERADICTVCNDLHRGAFIRGVTSTVRRKKGHRLRGIAGSIPFLGNASQVPMDIARLGFGGGDRVIQCLTGIHAHPVIPIHVYHTLKIIRAGFRYLVCLHRQLRAADMGVTVTIRTGIQVQGGTGNHSPAGNFRTLVDMDIAPAFAFDGTVAHINILPLRIDRAGRTAGHIGDIH